MLCDANVTPLRFLLSGGKTSDCRHGLTGLFHAVIATSLFSHSLSTVTIERGAKRPCPSQPLQFRHQVTEPVDLVIIQRTALQPLYILGQRLHRAALEHRPQRHVQL